MAATDTKKVFESPGDPDIPIWRYMDFTKYVAMLSNSSLFFARADIFDDPYEGATSYANVKLRSNVAEKQVSGEESSGSSDKESGGKQNSPDRLHHSSKYLKWMRQWTYISCWHMNEYESAAMWQLYSHTYEAIALRTSYRRLRECLPDKIHLGVVKYIDYEKDWMPEGNPFWPFVHKRKSFEHERELRAVIQELPENDEGPQVGKSNPQNGKHVSMELQKLIDRVYVSPNAPSWLHDLVREVTGKFDLDVEITQSNLSKEPIF